MNQKNYINIVNNYFNIPHYSLPLDEANKVIMISFKSAGVGTMHLCAMRLISKLMSKNNVTINLVGQETDGNI